MSSAGSGGDRRRRGDGERRGRSEGDRRRRSEAVLEAMARRGRDDLGVRFRRLRLTAIPLAQTAIGAGLAWWIATSPPIDHDRPFFAPIAALISLGVGLGQRLPRVIELVGGVALGVLVGDLLIALIGTGVAQIMLVVALAVAAAVLLGGGALTVTQAGSSAVLVATLVPPTAEQLINLDRFVDALVGGLVGIVVSAVLLPLNPITSARRAVEPVVSTMAELTSDLSRALQGRNRLRVEAVLNRARRTQQEVDALHSTIEGAREISRIAPLRWRDRGQLASYLDAATPIDHAGRNVRVLARHSVTLLSRDEPVPPRLPEALDHVSGALRSLQEALRRGADPAVTRREALEAARLATEALKETGGFEGQVVVAGVRALASDVLRAAGVDSAELNELLPDLPEGPVHYG